MSQILSIFAANIKRLTMIIKPLSKTELAWQYSPDSPQVTALNRLGRWIKGDHELLTALKEAGYQERQRLLTARQVKIIYEYLGNPLEEELNL